jgi:hypothetical protein
MPALWAHGISVAIDDIVILKESIIFLQHVKLVLAVRAFNVQPNVPVCGGFRYGHFLFRGCGVLSISAQSKSARSISFRHSLIS